MTDLKNAKNILQAGDYTCVLCKGNETVSSCLRGVKPLVSWYAGGREFSGFSAADKVVGKATAFLYTLLGVKAVYAGVLSRSALEALTGHGIETQYGTLVENIINRAGDGICPFEQAVLDISDSQTAYAAIREKMAAMHIQMEPAGGQ